MDDKLPNVDVCMLQRDLRRVPSTVLPAGYRIRGYREGDLATWLAIQHSADQLYTATAEVFARSLPGDEAYLAERVLFLVDPAGAEVGTITAWSDTKLGGEDLGHIHWVAISAAAQGHGLAKPMLGAACAVLQQQGYTAAYLETNTRRLPAVNLYLKFGFRPHPMDAAQLSAWRTIAARLKYPIDLAE